MKINMKYFSIHVHAPPHPPPPAATHPTHIDPLHRHQIRARALGKITGIFLQRREILKLEILMLCLRLIFFFFFLIQHSHVTMGFIWQDTNCWLAWIYSLLKKKKQNTINKRYLRRTFFEVAELVTLGYQVISLSAPTPATVRAELCLGVCWNGWSCYLWPRSRGPVTWSGHSSRAGSHLARAENARSRP